MSVRSHWRVAVLGVVLPVLGLAPLAVRAQPSGADPADPSPACVVVESKELMITDLSVVEDCLRTTWGPCLGLPNPSAQGAWTFGKLIEGVAGTNDPVVLSDFVLKWLDHWNNQVNVNSFDVPGRGFVDTLVTQPWLDASGGGTLDMQAAPFRLLAIVNRVDLRNNGGPYGQANAGEARFVFGVLNVTSPFDELPFTVIFEYGITAESCDKIKDWAQRWHALGTVPFGSRFNARLQAITDTFTKIGANPSKPNGSAINQIRTNEIDAEGPWELREFVLNPFVDVFPAPLEQTTVKQTPNQPDIFGHPELLPQNRMESQLVADFINEFEIDILANNYTVPNVYQNQPLLGGAVVNNFDFWNGFNSPPINNNDARHIFSLNTCNGCHGRETDTGFLQITTRSAGVESSLAGFLTGTDVIDPVDTNVERHFDDLERRAKDLCRLLQTPCAELLLDAPVNRTH